MTPEQEDKLEADIDAKTFQGYDGASDQDMSCSQFAALGIWTAKRHDVKGVDDALRKAAVTARTFQDIPTGVWNYISDGHPGGNFRDTSTCCGLIMISLGQAVAKSPNRFSRMSRSRTPSSIWET